MPGATFAVASPNSSAATSGVLRLLMVEDCEDDAELSLRELRKHGFNVRATRVTSAETLTQQLRQSSWDLVISEFGLPSFNGRDAVRLVKSISPDVPVIMVSGTIGEEHAVEAMRDGASDFVVKTKLHRLGPAVDRELRDASGRIEQRRIAAALAESQEDIRQMQKLEAIGQLAGGVAHDFNNLLTAILGYTDLVLDSLAPDDRNRADIEEVRHAGLRAVDLTRQLLAFSRRQVLNTCVLDLNEIVNDVGRLLRRVIGENIALVTPGGSDLWQVRADQSQVEQIIMNLAVNGRDAMPDGGTLTIETANVVVAAAGQQDMPACLGNYVLLQVRDTGTGIPESVLHRIFEPFFTTKAAGKGTGLGLATVYGIVQQSGGSIFVESEPAHGTIFSIYLPQAAADDAPAAEPADRPSIDGNDSILLVEDEPSVRDLAVRVLRAAGYQVIAADGPLAALRAAAAHPEPIRLLLTDVVMPEMSGPALAERLLTTWPSLQVLFMSGFTGESVDAIERLAKGDIIAKPFTPLGLVEQVRAALGTAVS